MMAAEVGAEGDREVLTLVRNETGHIMALARKCAEAKAQQRHEEIS